MTKDELHWYRENILAMKREIYRLIERAEHLESMAMKTTTTISDMPRGGSTSSDRMADAVILQADTTAEIDRKTLILYGLQQRVENAIECLDPRVRTVFIAYYSEAIPTLEQVAKLCHYSKRHTERLHGYGLMTIQKASLRNMSVIGG